VLKGEMEPSRRILELLGSSGVDGMSERPKREKERKIARSSRYFERERRQFRRPEGDARAARKLRLTFGKLKW